VKLNYYCQKYFFTTQSYYLLAQCK